MKRSYTALPAGGALLLCGFALLLCGFALLACAGKPSVNPATANNGRGAQRTPVDQAAAARINLQLGIGYLQEGSLAIAKEKLERAQSQDPHNAEIHGAMGLLDERLGKDKEADREYRTALELAPRDPSMLNNYAVFLCSHNHTDQGVRNFEQAATNPLYLTPWAAYTNAGVCLRAAHRDPEAAQRFARALQSNPAYSEAVYQASDLDFTHSRYDDARLRIEVFLLTNPATPDLLLLAFRIAQAQSDAAAQMRYAGRLAQEFPNSDQAHALAASRVNPG
jgi:type IV pilus assembly protein PilF